MKLISFVLFLFLTMFVTLLWAQSPSPSPLQLPDQESIGLVKWMLTAWASVRSLGDMPLAGIIGALCKLLVDFFKTGAGFKLFCKIPDRWKLAGVAVLSLLASIAATLIKGEPIGAAFVMAGESMAAAVLFNEILKEGFGVGKKKVNGT